MRRVPTATYQFGELGILPTQYGESTRWSTAHVGKETVSALERLLGEKISAVGTNFR
jgi:hypothetical protein